MPAPAADSRDYWGVPCENVLKALQRRETPLALAKIQKTSHHARPRVYQPYSCENVYCFLPLLVKASSDRRSHGFMGGLNLMGSQLCSPLLIDMQHHVSVHMASEGKKCEEAKSWGFGTIVNHAGQVRRAHREVVLCVCGSCGWCICVAFLPGGCRGCLSPRDHLLMCGCAAPHGRVHDCARVFVTPQV
jgi:hypothetical protein